jgi:hypothetical protein
MLEHLLFTIFLMDLFNVSLQHPFAVEHASVYGVPKFEPFFVADLLAPVLLPDPTQHARVNVHVFVIVTVNVPTVADNFNAVWAFVCLVHFL